MGLSPGRTRSLLSLIHIWLKKRASNYLSRGKVEVYVSIVTVEGTPYKISVNEPVARGYLRAADTLAALGIPNDLTVSRLMGLSDVLTLEKEDEDLEALWTDCLLYTSRCV